jgi:hypothetical protein
MTPINLEKETRTGWLVSCKQAALLVSLSFERRLSLREFIVMRLHLCLCKTCSFYRAQISVLRKVFIRHEELLDNVPPLEQDRLSLQAKERIRGALGRKG